MAQTLMNKYPQSLTKDLMLYCPGCGHGIVHRLIAEIIDELGIQNRTLGIAPVGCSVFADKYFNVDMVQVAHGRAPAVATGMKRSKPDCIVFVYQGDGDIASIGMAEIVHAASRSENITVIFINNAIYGMTGGQMAPTTLIGQKTTTCPPGRDPKLNGYPIKLCEMLATLEGARYLERTTVHTPQNVVKTKRAIKKAFQYQIDGHGFSMVEVLSMCPTGWYVLPVQATKYVQEKMLAVYPVGVYKDIL